MDTNEQIAIRIRTGDRAEIAHLWERLERFFRQQSGRVYRRHETACRYAGIEPDDLLQSCLIALYRAVQDYDPESGYKLTTYIHRHLMTAFAECCGYRQASATRSPVVIAWMPLYLKRTKPQRENRFPTLPVKKNTTG